MITKEQYERMLPYEQHFFTAVHGDYARNVTMEGFIVLDELYKEIFKRESNMKSGCNRCRLQGLKDLGKLFYEFKDAAQADVELENKTQVVDNKVVKKKRATDKKNGGGK